MCVSNRTAGKTTYFLKLLLTRALKNDHEFMLVFRKLHDLSDLAATTWESVANFFPDYHITEKSHKRGLIKSLWASKGADEPKRVAWGVALSTIETLKRNSHLFKNVNEMYMDEFILENDRYLDNELDDLMSLHTTVARGYGQMVRYVALYMCGNPYSMINPYYSYFKIAERLKTDTHFIRGHGWVFEQSINEFAREAQKQSAFNRAFDRLNYAAYSAEGVYFNDNLSMIGKLNGRMRYVCTLVGDKQEFGVMEALAHNCIYVSDKSDSSNPTRIAASADQVNSNTFLFESNSFMIKVLRNAFRCGSVRFKNLDAKVAFIRAIKY